MLRGQEPVLLRRREARAPGGVAVVVDIRPSVVELRVTVDHAAPDACRRLDVDAVRGGRVAEERVQGLGRRIAHEQDALRWRSGLRRRGCEGRVPLYEGER